MTRSSYLNYSNLVNPFRRLADFLSYPSHSRTMGLLAFLIVLLAIPLTVNIAQKQQELRQHAAGSCDTQNECDGYPNGWSYGTCSVNINEGQPCGSGGTCSNGSCIVGDSLDANGSSACKGTGHLPICGGVTYNCVAGPAPNLSHCATPAPAPTFNCIDKNCTGNTTCIGSSGSNDLGTFCLTKGVGAIGSYCGDKNISTPVHEVCSSGYCDSTFHCATPITVPTAAPPAAPSQPSGTCSASEYTYTCGCPSNDNGKTEAGHKAVCSKSTVQDDHCYSNITK